MRIITLAHRWMGVVLCLFFAAWFLSGAVLIYHPFPSLSQAEQLSKKTGIDFSKIKITPKEAVGKNSGFDRFRLIDVAGQPVYVLHPQIGPVITIGADDGKPLNLLTGETAGEVAEKFLGEPALRIYGPLNYDQWIVPNRYDPYRPFYRISMLDKKDTVLYVSSRTGEVLQKTEGSERAWNYVGAVVHWIYPTVLRSNWALWDQTVWCISLFGVVTTLAGLWLGVVRFREAQKTTRTHSPYKGWLRMHHILGLFSGIFIFFWIFSGWLSMDHGRIFSQPNPNTRQIQSFSGKPMKQTVERISVEALEALKQSNEVEVFSVGGKTYVMKSSTNGKKLYKPKGREVLSPTEFTELELINALKAAWPGVNIQSTQRPEKFDIYGQLRESSLPPNTLRIILSDPMQTWIHIDMDSGQIVSVMNRSRRLYRWLFNGLHSLDFPGLANHRPLWDVLILSMLAGGFFFSITGVVVGWKRLFNH